MNISRIASRTAGIMGILVLCMVPVSPAHAQTPTTLGPASCSLKVGQLGDVQTQIKYTTGQRTVLSTSIDLNGGTISNLGTETPSSSLTLYWTTGTAPTTPANSQPVYSGEMPTPGSFTSVSTFPISGLTPGTAYTFILGDSDNHSCSLGTITTTGQNPTPSTPPGGTIQGSGSGTSQPSGTIQGVGSGTVNTSPSGGTIQGSGSGTTNPPSPVQDPSRLQNFTNINSIPEAFGALLNKIIIPLAIPFVALAIIYTGFLFVEARGNQEKLKKAKEALKWTIIGSAVILGSYVIAQVVENTVREIRSTAADVRISEIHRV